MAVRLPRPICFGLVEPPASVLLQGLVAPWQLWKVKQSVTRSTSVGVLNGAESSALLYHCVDLCFSSLEWLPFFHPSPLVFSSRCIIGLVFFCEYPGISSHLQRYIWSFLNFLLIIGVSIIWLVQTYRITRNYSRLVTLLFLFSYNKAQNRDTLARDGTCSTRRVSPVLDSILPPRVSIKACVIIRFDNVLSCFERVLSGCPNRMTMDSMAGCQIFFWRWVVSSPWNSFSDFMAGLRSENVNEDDVILIGNTFAVDSYCQLYNIELS